MPRQIISYLLFFLLIACRQKTSHQWETYGGDKAQTHYSSSRQIDTGNVQQLTIAWAYHTKDAEEGTQIEVNPLVIDNILYGVSPKLKLFAIDAATGKEKWVFNPAVSATRVATEGENFSVNVCRGITYYKDANNGDRIFYTAGSLLYCIGAENGKPVLTFGNNGTIDLHDGLGRDAKRSYVTSTTPGMLYKDLLIVGTRVAEEAGAAPGHVRAYDVHSGKLRWIFHTIPYPGETGYDSWADSTSWQYAGGANAWAGFSLDEKEGLLFAPVGSATYDFYGGKRKGNNLFANCVVAIDAASGKYKWHYQLVHHDVWDRDPPTPPVLVEVMKEGKKIDAVCQLTKGGLLFLLDRKTGKPLYPVKEMPVAASALEGEQLSTTQPLPGFFEPFSRQLITEKDLNTLVPDSSFAQIKKQWTSVNKGFYAPPSKEGSLLTPGTLGGAEWGGPAFDPSTGLLYINANETSNIITMVEAKKIQEVNGQTKLKAGKIIYETFCMGCHGPDRKGSGVYPSLIGVQQKYTIDSFRILINSGRRMMPAFKQLSEEEKEALASYILDIKNIQQQTYKSTIKTDERYRMPYLATGYNRFLTPEGYPANMPPWGSLTAVNLNTGKTVWRDTLGDYPEFKAKGVHTGCDNFGGPVVTAGGLLFIAATRDGMFRAYNKRTGQLLLEKTLPTAGFATPAVYEVNGKQYIVIACGGGGKAKTKSGDAYVAFALP